MKARRKGAVFGAIWLRVAGNHGSVLMQGASFPIVASETRALTMPAASVALRRFRGSVIMTKKVLIACQVLLLIVGMSVFQACAEHQSYNPYGPEYGDYDDGHVWHDRNWWIDNHRDWVAEYHHEWLEQNN